MVARFRVPLPSLVRDPLPLIWPAKVRAFVLVTVTDAAIVSALLRVRLSMPGVRMALLRVTALVPKEKALPATTVAVPPLPLMVEPLVKELDPPSVSVPLPFIESEEAVTFDANVEELLVVIARELEMKRLLLITSTPVPLLVKLKAEILEPERFTVPAMLFTVMLLALTAVVTVIWALVPKVTLSPVEK